MEISFSAKLNANQIFLNWPNIPNAKGYKIYRKLDDKWTLLANIDSSVNSYHAVIQEDAQSILYKMQFINKEHQVIEFANQQTIYPLSEYKMSYTLTDMLSVNWSKPTLVKIYKKCNLGNFEYFDIISSDKFVDSQILPGNIYVYKFIYINHSYEEITIQPLPLQQKIDLDLTIVDTLLDAYNITIISLLNHVKNYQWFKYDISMTFSDNLKFTNIPHCKLANQTSLIDLKYILFKNIPILIKSKDNLPKILIGYNKKHLKVYDTFFSRESLITYEDFSEDSDELYIFIYPQIISKVINNNSKDNKYFILDMQLDFNMPFCHIDFSESINNLHIESLDNKVEVIECKPGENLFSTYKPIYASWLIKIAQYTVSSSFFGEIKNNIN